MADTNLRTISARDSDRIQLLIRLARKSPEDSAALLQWAEELLGASQNGATSGAQVDNLALGPDPHLAADIEFPLQVFIITKTRRVDGVLYSDCTLQVNGTRYGSPSAAATTELGYSEDGWRKWMYKDVRGSIKPIDVLRRRGLIGSPPVRRRRQVD